METPLAIVREINFMIVNCILLIQPTIILMTVSYQKNCFVKGGTKPRHKHDKAQSRNRKCMAVEQAIISVSRPRPFVSPLLLSTGLYVHRKYGLKELIDLVSTFGFSETYKAVKKYEYSISKHSSPDLDDDKFVQFIFDNADFNVLTLDGHNTSHSIGGNKCITPAGTGDRAGKLFSDDSPRC